MAAETLGVLQHIVRGDDEAVLCQGQFRECGVGFRDSKSD